MVNIHEVEINKEDWAGDKLIAIFLRQEELMGKYHDIEKANGLLQTPLCPVDLHDRFGQARLKDFAWRITEELGESLDAYEKYLKEEHSKDHYLEEIADALHFLAEFTILAGIGPMDIKSGLGLPEGDTLDGLFALMRKPGELYIRVGDFVKYMGMACNCFKNKPWKQTHMLTDTVEFRAQVILAWKSFIGICWSAGLTAESLTQYYFGKSEVNRFRQRSNY